MVWDDHEVADNGSLTGAVNHDASEGDWRTRRETGTRVFREWLPLRLPDAEDPTRIFRSFEFGKLFDLVMIDTRYYGRDAPAGGLFTPGDPAAWGGSRPPATRRCAGRVRARRADALTRARGELALPRQPGGVRGEPGSVRGERRDLELRRVGRTRRRAESLYKAYVCTAERARLVETTTASSAKSGAAEPAPSA